MIEISNSLDLKKSCWPSNNFQGRSSIFNLEGNHPLHAIVGKSLQLKATNKIPWWRPGDFYTKYWGSILNVGFLNTFSLKLGWVGFLVQEKALKTVFFWGKYLQSKLRLSVTGEMDALERMLSFLNLPTPEPPSPPRNYLPSSSSLTTAPKPPAFYILLLTTMKGNISQDTR